MCSCVYTKHLKTDLRIIKVHKFMIQAISEATRSLTFINNLATIRAHTKPLKMQPSEVGEEE